jgi:alkylation response protein AidB-like acyl-CoA dehydrogenase
VDFALDEFQQELKQQAHAWLAQHYPLDRDWDGPQDARWAEIAELGWLDVAEADLGFVEEALLLEEMGYACYPGPYLAHVLALPSLSGDERAAAVSGERTFSLAVNGRVAEAGGEELESVDPTRPLVPAVQARPSNDSARLYAALAAEAVGVAQRALDLGIKHAKTREQFGKPIGVYQAVSHPLADTYGDVELARSLAYWAAWCVEEDDEQAPLAAAAAKAFCTEAAVVACERSIQVHGGTGFTWEHPLHRFYKRALWLEGFGKRPSELHAELADELLGVAITA